MAMQSFLFLILYSLFIVPIGLVLKVFGINWVPKLNQNSKSYRVVSKKRDSQHMKKMK